MKILLNANHINAFKNKNNSGGIENLNFNLFKNLKLSFKKIYIRPNKNIKYDIIISSNDARIFDKYKSNKNVLWLHNKLQIEKAIRKKQFLSLIKNKIHAVFVSEYLKNNTSKLYNFKKSQVIPNFLDKNFENLKITFQRKQIVMWAVSRDRGLSEVIELWKKKINKNYPAAEFHIFGNNQFKSKKTLLKYNIFCHKRVSKKILIKYYKTAICSICLGYDETFCLNAVESMACGTPVLSFKMTALDGLIKNNFNGFKLNNFLEIFDQLEKLILLNKKKRSNLISKTYNFSKQFYFKKVKSKWINLITE